MGLMGFRSIPLTLFESLRYSKIKAMVDHSKKKLFFLILLCFLIKKPEQCKIDNKNFTFNMTTKQLSIIKYFHTAIIPIYFQEIKNDVEFYFSNTNNKIKFKDLTI